MSTETNNTLNEAYGVLKQNAEKYNWNITGRLDGDVGLTFPSRNKSKRFQRAINKACKKGSFKSFNLLLYRMSQAENAPLIKLKLGDKELEIRRKRKIWKKLRDEAEVALLDYKKEKGDYFKNL